MKKCKYIFLLVCALLPILASCTDYQTTNSAAQEFYLSHEGREDITVAYVGGVELGDENIDAVMMSADDDSAWASLKQEFGIISPDEFSRLFLDDSLLVDLLGDMGDSLVEKIHSSDYKTHVITIETNDLVTDSMVIALMEQPGAEVPDTVKPTEASRFIRLNSNELDPDARGGLQEKISQIKDQSSRIKKNDDDGYLIANSDSTHTIWFFFFHTTEEYEAILQYIKRDL